MTPTQALRDIRGYAGAGQVQLTRHARERMALRGMGIRDVMHALTNAQKCRAADDAGKWRVTGPDLDGDDLTAVVALVSGVIVVTVF